MMMKKILIKEHIHKKIIIKKNLKISKIIKI